MRTIKVSDEMYNSLMELSKELNSQDHRGTAMPYIFQIQTTDEKPVPDGFGQSVWVMDGSILLRTEAEIKEEIEDYLYGQSPKILYDDLDEWEREQILKNTGYEKFDVREETELQNAFLTAKACKEHIKKNGYHYKKPLDYLSGAFRNPELELVFKFLCELTGGKIHK